MSSTIITSHESELTIIVVQNHIPFRGKAGAIYSTFPWMDLVKNLYDLQIMIIGWPCNVRLLGDGSLKKQSFSGLEKQEQYQFAIALHKNQLEVIKWTKG